MAGWLRELKGVEPALAGGRITVSTTREAYGRAKDSR
jgi:hypothetical protein